MLSYHSDEATKTRYLARVRGHADADEIIKGQYWEAGKGCAVGCTIHGASHTDFEQELGIPVMLAWLEDVIFEGLPNRLAKTWPERFLSAIEPGRDLSRVGWQMLHWLLTDSEFAVRNDVSIRSAVGRCTDVMIPLMQGRAADIALAKDMATIAWSAAKTGKGLDPDIWIAECAARAVESVAMAETDVAASAEHAATALTAAISHSADYVVVSEKLLALLRAA